MTVICHLKENSLEEKMMKWEVFFCFLVVFSRMINVSHPCVSSWTPYNWLPWIWIAPFFGMWASLASMNSTCPKFNVCEHITPHNWFLGIWFAQVLRSVSSSLLIAEFFEFDLPQFWCLGALFSSKDMIYHSFEVLALFMIDLQYILIATTLKFVGIVGFWES